MITYHPTSVCVFPGSIQHLCNFTTMVRVSYTSHSVATLLTNLGDLRPSVVYITLQPAPRYVTYTCMYILLWCCVTNFLTHETHDDCIVIHVWVSTQQLSEIPAVHMLGPLQLSARPVIHALTALTLAWKLEFADFLHKHAQVSIVHSLTYTYI